MLIRHCDIARYLTSLDIFSALIAALAHDADHPGLSNAYLIAVKNPLAITHNDDAVLERHHASTTTKILGETENNVFSVMNSDDTKHSRKVILAAILGTDMSRHMEHVTALHERAERKSVTPFERASSSDRISLVTHIVHCADLSAQTLPSNVSEEFEGRLMEEVRLDEERSDEMIALSISAKVTHASTSVQDAPHPLPNHRKNSLSTFQPLLRFASLIVVLATVCERDC